MEVILFLFLGIVVFVMLKTWVFSSEEEKCFRRIWSMNKFGIFQERVATYERLFRKFDVNFSGDVDNEKISHLIGAAHHFDMTKNQRNLGVYVGPIVEKEISMQMSKHGKSEQYEALAKKHQDRGEAIIKALGMEEGS